MRNEVCVIACVVLLASCNKGPQVHLKNASVNQVSEAVSKSGVMTSDTMVQPGLWESKVTVQELNIPGMPPEYAGKMKQAMAENREQSSKHCLSPDDVKKPKEEFFAGRDKSCHYEHFTMGSGKIDIEMVCNEEGATQTTNMNGSYTPTSYAMDMSSNASGGGPRSGTTMKMHVDAHRVGECSSKDG